MAEMIFRSCGCENLLQNIYMTTYYFDFVQYNKFVYTAQHCHRQLHTQTDIILFDSRENVEAI